jgi:hypothetical protein
VTRPLFETYLRATIGIAYDGETLLVAAGDDADWLQQRIAPPVIVRSDFSPRR